MTLQQRSAWALMVIALSIATPAAQPDTAQLLDSADALLRTWDYRQAQPLYERALETARETERESDIARALLGLGQIAKRDGRVATGRAGVVEALAIFERLDDRVRIAEANIVMSAIEQAARNQPAAVAHAERALAIADAIQNHRGIAEATLQLTEVKDLDVEAEGDLLARAAASARAAGDGTLEGQALHDFGDRLFGVGQYERSLEMLTSAAAAYETAKAPLELGTVYNSVGRVYRAHGRYDEALKYQKAALELHRQGAAVDPFRFLQSLNAVSVVYSWLDDLAAARSYMEQALAVSASIPASPAAARAGDFLRANMAAILIDDGDMAGAAAALEQVIASGRDSFPSVRHRQLSMAYRGLGRGADALAAAERAVALCGEAKIECIGAYNERSDAHAAVGNRDAALLDLSLTLRGIEDQRAQLVPSDFFKRDFSSSYQWAYGSAIARQLDAGQQREALETGELARSRAFLDLLASRSIVPAAVATGPALPLTLRGGGIGSGAASSVTMAPSTAADLIRTAARLRSSLLLYWVSADETVIWVVTPDGLINARRVKVTRRRLAALVRDTAPFTDSKRVPTAPVVLRESSQAWRELYTLADRSGEATAARHDGRAAHGRAARYADEPELCRTAGHSRPLPARGLHAALCARRGVAPIHGGTGPFPAAFRHGADGVGSRSGPALDARCSVAAIARRAKRSGGHHAADRRQPRTVAERRGRNRISRTRTGAGAVDPAFCRPYRRPRRRPVFVVPRARPFARPGRR